MSVSQQRAVMFVDATGSTRLYEEFGDERAHALIAGRLRRLERNVQENGGRVIKRLGDGLMCSFAEPDAAVRAARMMQQDDEDRRASELGIHVGCHYGPVLEAEGDLYGDCVNVAARIAGLAQRGQVVVTRELADRLDPELRASVRRIGDVTVKGRRDPVHLLEVIWEEEADLTIVRSTLIGARIVALRLLAGARELRFDAARAGPVALGRDPSSDIFVNDPRASRRHAHIERRGEAFVIVDHSANGTWVAVGDEEWCLRRQEVALRSNGRIALGRSTTERHADVIEFWCE